MYKSFATPPTPAAAVRLRFAPSPTGQLHLGGLRTALFNYLLAKRHGGKLVLRVEDTDQTRLVPGSMERMMDMFKWAGIEFDEGPPELVSGSQSSSVDDNAVGPYVQSHRLPLYRQYASQLLECGHAYRCFCSPERLASLKAAHAKQSSRVLPYDRRCRDMPEEEWRRRLNDGEPFVVRMKIPLNHASTTFDDLVKGRVSFKYRLLDDQVLLKSDGWATYHLANVVDDHLMRISHVVRGEEWLNSTPKHLLLYRYLNWQAPQFAHLPLLLSAENKAKLSKRHHDMHAEWYRQQGYSPEALVQYAATMGWSPPGGHPTKGQRGVDEQRLWGMHDLAKQFDWSGLRKNPVLVPIGTGKHARLDLLNKAWLKALSGQNTARVVHELKQCDASVAEHSDEYVRAAIDLLKARVTRLPEVATVGDYLFTEGVSLDTAHAQHMRTQAAISSESARRFLAMAEQCLPQSSDEPSSLDATLWDEFVGKVTRDAQSMLSMDGRQVKLLLRWALTGRPVGAALGDTLALLATKVNGIDTLRQRIHDAQHSQYL